jgi:hypothetical protein
LIVQGRKNFWIHAYFRGLSSEAAQGGDIAIVWLLLPIIKKKTHDKRKKEKEIAMCGSVLEYSVKCFAL